MTEATETNIIRLSNAFVGVLKEWLTSEELKDVIARNSAAPDAEWCASHDFCDANEAMLEAFEVAGFGEADIFSRDDGSAAPDDALFNAAWSHARKTSLS